MPWNNHTHTTHTTHLYQLADTGTEQIYLQNLNCTTSIAFSPNSTYFAYGLKDGAVHLCDLKLLLLNQFIEGNDLIYSLFLSACYQKSLLLDKNHHLRKYFKNLPQEIKIILQEKKYVQYEQIEISGQHILNSRMICSSENKPME